ncbi:tRNA (adenosine(37)-N6)-threonylcarbamoyltransferase complex transferase subunit TsaD [bacterium]|nr:tRNA (adenosine(37)-N6)-threonylcarbamoyltransferase complex transferase subunit TsaD [bacterium]
MLCAVETSFDETGIALCDSAGLIRASLLSSQVELHAPYGGCVPELAARTHLSDLPQLWQHIEPELRAGIEHIGVTSGPGLPGCLLAGVNFCRGLAAHYGIALHGLNHLQGHIFSPFMGQGSEPGLSLSEIPFPHVALLVSGGHTELFLVRGVEEIELLGQTQDDAVGELLDKVSAMLGLGYPGGARLERLAREYPGMTELAEYSGQFELPVPMRSRKYGYNFSYSGLKTAVRKQIQERADHPALADNWQASLVAALFSSVVESLWFKLERAVEEYKVSLLTVSGGVAINGFIRAAFAERAGRMGVELRVPHPRHCLDNAEMMAWLLKLRLEAGIPAREFDARSNWVPGEPGWND